MRFLFVKKLYDTIMNSFTKFFVVILFCLTIYNAKANNNDSDYEYKYNYGLDKVCSEVYDPYKQFNKKMFIFNLTLDRLLLKPLALGYNAVTNDYIKSRVGSFFENISMPLTTVNYALQMNFNEGMKSFWRLLINTTLGIGGLFDVASKMNLAPDPQTFSNTLAHYGATPGPYLVLPFFGGSMGRDIFDTLLLNNGVTWVIKIPKNFNLSLIGIKIIHDRSMLLTFSDLLEQNSTDYYIATRTAIFQNHESKMKYPIWFKCPPHQARSRSND